MRTEMNAETINLVEVAALRLAQKPATSEKEVKELVNALRRAIPDWLYTSQIQAVRVLCERFGIKAPAAREEILAANLNSWATGR